MPELQQNILTRKPGISLPFKFLISWGNILFALTKGNVSLGVSFTAGLGYVLCTGEITSGSFLCLMAVFFLSGGCCALNQLQEAKPDALMERTAHRPIPAGKINAYTGLFISIFSLLLGLWILLPIACQKSEVLALAVLAPFWYNGVYTYAKRITRFAVLIGAPLGALGPMIGWCAAGGALSDPAILCIGIFSILWQVPHFFLILLSRSPEYERAGFKTWNHSLTPRQFRRVIFVWMVAAVVAGLFLGFRHPLRLPWSLFLLAGSAALVIKAASLLLQNRSALAIKVTPLTLQNRSLLDPRDPMLYGVGVLVLLCLG